MAKSATQAIVGTLVQDGLLDPDAPTGIEAWAEDGRADITLEHLLRMRDGLDFAEDYVDAGVSDVIEMLFGSGKEDVAAYAMARPLAHPPGTVWSYSSGTTNIISYLAKRASGGTEAFLTRARDRLFVPAGMTSADPRCDAAGTFIGSSFLHATARDFARFGLVYLNDGAGILDPAWVAHARRPTEGVTEENRGYGAQWWLWSAQPDWLVAQGYETQRTIVDYGREIVIVRLGKTPEEIGGETVDAFLQDLAAAI
jgi:CubicO group peptidase (beta-lactamase class C family)